MLPRNKRLPIAAFPKRGFAKLNSSYFFVKTAPNGLIGNRFAVVISKTAAKLATRRHSIKRQVLASLANCPELGKDILVIAQPELARATKDNLVKDLKKIKTLLSS